MSRSGYVDDCDDWALIRWRGAVNSAIKGKRGQQALREIVAALDALPERRLVSESLVDSSGEFCTLGALGRARGLDMEPIDPEDRESVARAFGISEALAAEIMYENDEGAADDWMYIDYEICGPMRPHYPDYGSHKKSASHQGRRQMMCYSDAGLCQRTPKCVHACDLRIQPVLRAHTADAACWCLPVLDYTDPETGASVYVHQRPQ